MTHQVLRNTALMLGVVLLVACRTAVVYNAVNVPIVSPQPLTLDLIRNRIGRAARLREWEIEDIQPGVVFATKRSGSHVATAAVTFDTSSFTITLRNSINLRQRGVSIHKTYNRWAREFEVSIRQEIASQY